MSNTIISIEQTCKTTHEIKVKGILSEKQLDEIDDELYKMHSLDEVLDHIRTVRAEIIDYDEEGCYEGSDFEWNGSYVKDEEED